MNKRIEQLRKYLDTRFKNKSDYVIVEKPSLVLYSKVSVSRQTEDGIHNIIPYKAVFYISNDSFSYSQGYKLGYSFYV